MQALTYQGSSDVRAENVRGPALVEDDDIQAIAATFGVIGSVPCMSACFVHGFHSMPPEDASPGLSPGKGHP